MSDAAKQIWIGTSGFQYPAWKGAFYPEKMPTAKMLRYYAESFPTTEINYSFRRVPSEKTIRNWIAQTPLRFKFSLKAPQKITHFAKLRDCAATLAYFDKVMAGLGQKRGPVLFQLPPNFTKEVSVLDAFLGEMPATMRVAFEFRDASWFAEDVYAVLRAHGAALCVAESADLATPCIATADFGYVRLRREDYTAAAIKKWARGIEQRAAEWREVFVYFKHEDAGVGPKFAQQMQETLGLPVVAQGRTNPAKAAR